MAAIFKKEFKAYFHSIIGWLFLAFFLAFLGLYFYLYNLAMGYAFFGYALSGISMIFILLVPMVTMRIMAEEKKQRTDQLLFTSPVSAEKIILGKYMALVALFAIAMAVACFYPVILSCFGTINLKMTYAAIAGFFVIGCAYMAIGMFISALTESQAFAAVMTFIVVLVTCLADGIGSLFSTTAFTSLVTFTLLFLLVAIAFYLLLRKRLAGILAFVVCEAALLAVYLLKPTLLEGAVATFFGCFSMLQRYDNLVSGILKPEDFVYYISIAFLFYFLTVQTVKKERNKKLKHAAYVAAISAIAIVAVVFVNLFATRLNISKDLTASGKYSLTEETKEMLDGLEEEITLYYLAPSDESISWFDTIFGQYTKNSDHIKLVTVDPLMNPKFASQYTDAETSEFSVIVVNETDGRSRYVDYEDMLIVDYSFDYTTYSYNSTVTGLDVEGQLNSAIRYVTSDSLPKLYSLTGHGETTLGTNTQAMLTKANISYETAELMTLEEIPADCDVLFIGSPETDYTEKEMEVLEAYLENGGSVMIVAGYVSAGLPNFETLLARFGISMTDGIVIEGNSNYCMGRYPNYLLPSVSSSSEITSSIRSSKYVLTPVASGLLVSEELREGLSVEKLLSTSSSAYAKVDKNATTYSKESGDIDGPFEVGVYAADSATGAKAVIVSGYYMFEDSYANETSFGNIDLLINSINVMAGAEESAAIRTITLDDEEYVTLTTAQSNAIGLVVVILLPVFLLITGIVVMVVRRRK